MRTFSPDPPSRFKVKTFPVLIFGREYWERIINFAALVEEGIISPEDIASLSICGDARGSMGDYFKNLQCSMKNPFSR